MSDETKAEEKKEEASAKVEFTPEQQAHIDSMFNKKFAEVHTKVEAKAQLEIDELKAELETLKSTKKPNETKKEGNEDLTALQKKIEVLEADKIKGFQIACESNIISAASELKAINPRQVFDLIQKQVKIADDGTRTVINSEGQPRINGGGKPFTEKELVAEFLANNQHFVQASGKTGSGSQAPSFGESHEEDLLKLRPVERLTALRELKAAKK